MPPQKHQDSHGQHGQGISKDEHHIPDINGVNRQQDDPRHQGHEIGNAQIPRALGSVCLHHLGNHAAADDQGTGYSQKFKNQLNGHEASLLFKVWEMRLSPPAHYFFQSIKDVRLPKGLLEHLIVGLVVLFAEDAFPADGMVPAFVAYLFGVDEQGDVFHDKTECLSHGFSQSPGDSS